MGRIVSLIGVTLFFLSATAATADCLYVADPQKVTVGWTAFKTPAKKGVDGSFASVTPGGENRAASIVALLEGSRLTIDGTSVDTGNTLRDATIADAFFSRFAAGGAIVAAVGDARGDDDKGSLTLQVTMNGVEREVPMSYEHVGGRLTAVGYIDLLDFALAKPRDSLAKACREQHQGKTWNDVVIRFAAPVVRECE